MILRNLIFQLEVIKQRLPAGLVSHHKQQASQCNAEQQHRWAAYNLNPAPAQASTEGLFQQTRLIATTWVCLTRLYLFYIVYDMNDRDFLGEFEHIVILAL